MFEVRGHLLPQYGHFVQTLPMAVRCVKVATDYVIHIGLVITTHVQAEGAEGQALTACPILTFKQEAMEAVFVVQIRQQGHHSNRVGHMCNYEMDHPSALTLWRKSNSFSWVASPWGEGNGGRSPECSTW